MLMRYLSLIVLAAFLLISAQPAYSDAAMTAVYGPKQFTRTKGRPQTLTETFDTCGSAPSQIVITNGDADGKNRISSASIFLNGELIAGPRDFNQRVDRIVKPVVLGEQNELTITLASRPGSFVTLQVQSLASPVTLTAGYPGVSLLDSNTLLSALPVINTGTAAAMNVQTTAIELDNAGLILPTTLPYMLGSIPAEGSLVLDANFSGLFAPLASYGMTVDGTYNVTTDLGPATYCFSLAADLNVPPAAPGSAVLSTTTANAAVVSGGGYTQQPPDFDEEVNMPRWTVPTAPFVPGTSTATATTLTPVMTPSLPVSTTATFAPLSSDPPPIQFLTNNGLGLTSGNFNGQASTVAEPSGGVTAGGVVFTTANWTAAYSTDGGVNFTQLDPTTIFPNDTVGFCCDQIVQYVPSIGRFFWLLQGNGYRLAMASPQDIIDYNGTAWTYWNLTPGVFGSCASFDYPDMSVGNNSLYISWDAGGGGCSGGFQVARITLTGTNGLVNAGTISIGFTHPSDGPMAWGSHLMQNSVDEIFWAGHNSNSQMRVFSLKEGENTYYWRDVGISSWANNAPTSITPDGKDWLAKNFNGPGGNSFPRNGIIGATRSNNQLWFAWTAGTNSNFQQAHVEMVQLDRSNNFHKDQQVQIWNNGYAFAYPALSTNACTGEVGMSFEYGGNGNYENHVVGFWGDFIAYVTSSSDVGTNRFGDYVTIRQAPVTDANPGNLFAAFGYGLNQVPAPGTGTNTDLRYVLFGRPASSCVPIIN